MTGIEAIYRNFMNGDAGGFYDLMYPELLVYAHSLLGEDLAYMAEDCVQEAVFSSYIHKEELDSPEHWHAYLIACMRNKAVDYMRKRNSQNLYLEHSDTDPVLRDFSVDMIEQETLTRLYVAIRSLPEKYQEIFRLSFEEGMKSSDIAKLLSTTESNIRHRRLKFIQLLRERLGGHIDETTILVLLSLLTVEQN